MTIAEDINNIISESEKLKQEAYRLQKLAETYPDIKKYVGRWNKIVYCNKTVNNKVNKFDRRYNCGCCGDSPLEIWPYIETEFGKVYSDPPEFRVGNKSYSIDAEASPGWDGKMREAGISESVISQVQSYFYEIIKKRITELEEEAAELR